MTEPTNPEPAHTDDAPPTENAELPIAGQTDSILEGAAAAPVEAADNADGDGGNRLIDALKQVIDPELMINIVDLGLVYEVEQTDSTVNGPSKSRSSPLI